MVYCRQCAEKNGWPCQPFLHQKWDLCDACGKPKDCFDNPSKQREEREKQ